MAESPTDANAAFRAALDHMNSIADPEEVSWTAAAPSVLGSWWQPLYGWVNVLRFADWVDAGNGTDEDRAVVAALRESTSSGG